MDQQMIDDARSLQARYQEAVTKLATAQAKWILKEAAKQTINPHRPESLTIEVNRDPEDAKEKDVIKATFFDAGPLSAPNAVTITLLTHFGLDWKGPRSYGMASPKTLFFDFTIVPMNLSAGQ